MSDSDLSEEPSFSIVSSFVRERNVLFAMAKFSPLYVDYYLHLKDNRIEIDAENDELFKRGLAAFALHCVSRPRNKFWPGPLTFRIPC